MKAENYKRLFWGLFFLITAIIAIAMFTFGTIFVFIPLANLICTNPYTKVIAVFVVILLIFLFLKSMDKDK